MSENFPEGVSSSEKSDPMNAMEIDEYIEDHLGILREYHADHVATGILDDDLPEAFDAWVVTLTEEDLIKIVEK